MALPEAVHKPEAQAWLNELPRESLQAMLDAGREVLEWRRILAKTGDNVVGCVLKHEGPFYVLDHYPKGDVYDPESHGQWYYHAHDKSERPGEHGHFHTFMRGGGMPEGVAGVAGEERLLDHLTLTAEPGEEVRFSIRLRFSDPDAFAGHLRVTLPDDSSRDVPMAPSGREPGQFVATFVPQQQGVHAVTLDTGGLAPPVLETKFAVYDDRRERLNVAADHQLLERLAAMSNGSVIPFDEPERLLEHLELEMQARSVPSQEDRDLWHTPLWLIVLIGAFSLEWLIRRRMHLR